MEIAITPIVDHQQTDCLLFTALPWIKDHPHPLMLCALLSLMRKSVHSRMNESY